ncbi:hypothetical protein CRM22_006914 [Opisthorchis felineus]|uniref:Uncharacterized protein n=1 Tax=Opisthorchis felineus TaxID=147828 RepID=A0A4S2LJ18_OPIFE|nr:hypothetical protein CRM22_006914 [Opisthorchis felineus]
MIHRITVNQKKFSRNFLPRIRNRTEGVSQRPSRFQWFLLALPHVSNFSTSWFTSECRPLNYAMLLQSKTLSDTVLLSNTTGEIDVSRFRSAISYSPSEVTDLSQIVSPQKVAGHRSETWPL